MTRVLTVVSRLGRRIWFRAGLFTLGALLLALGAEWLEPMLPALQSLDIGQNSVGNLLTIMASSMLAVTTFSLTAMVSAYSSASSVGTPRATQLLIQDRTSQDALSTFLGSFVFSVVGIAALSTGYYGEAARTLLFVGTLIVIAVVVITLLHWIGYLADFGRMADIIDRVDKAATRAAAAYAEQPALGGLPGVIVPEGARPVVGTDSGFVTLVDTAALQGIAEEHDLTVHVRLCPGSAAHVGEPLAYVEGRVTDDQLDAVRRAFEINAHRTYDQDPRLGLVALAEIAIRALSPAVNDPGTAIEVLGALERVTLVLLGSDPSGEAQHPRVHVPTATLADFLDDGFRPIARDGAGQVEVGMRLQRTLKALANSATPDDAETIRTAAEQALARANAALDDEGDLAAVRAAAG